MIYRSTKTFTHSVGLSCAFRQWKAKSHCRFLHGYAIQVRIEFEANKLDERNWVVDFGGLKALKKWLEDIFDHKTLVAKDDPELMTYCKMHERGICDLVILDAVGCEKFAELIFDKAENFLRRSEYDGRVVIRKVEVSEHQGNSGMAIREDHPIK
ncbi:COG0720 6-pyruvoyl-tetrahydropterin synthase [uncultured Caudovirales phage]|uniref:COG0720 6-pyruvoyl-tetrahydropterin synthase n=1 Tax=uncultured Caudovirales phage TaxID=2100421 RepID=A0A6J5MNX1_9CAUD|nr:COG0720 6-pyruvoyl-tetrahydropterin synthase [uncultured Caudovirales phage]